ncbi:MAG: peroxiredoxin [Cyclobacteriaceae bacterium]
MALSEGSKAPDFTLPSTEGRTFKLSEAMAGKPCILYFYPKDFTPGCTQEACEFRDHFAFFKELDIDVVGISRDSIATHRKFKEANQLPFELLADERGDVSKLYKASLPFLGVTRRISYLLDKNHKIVAAYESMFAATNHIKKMTKAVKENF